MDRTCGWCGARNNLARADARFCSGRCRVASHRAAKKLPAVMTGADRWVRASGKRPLVINGYSASSTNNSTWSSFEAVSRSSVGDGFGFMLGGGVGCYDLDHVSDADARDFIVDIPEPILFAERSMSGTGVHVFISAPESRGWKRGNVERYTRERFIRMTGVRFDY